MPKSKICSPDPGQLNQLALIPAAAQFLSHQFLILLTPHELASFLAWRAVADDEFEILQLETLPSFRRQGFARILLRAFLVQNVGNVFLEVRESNAAARKLYESEGFTSISKRRDYYSNPPEDAIVLGLRSC